MPVSPAPPNNGRFAPIAVPALTVVVFAAVVAIVTLQLRAGLQQQILRQEAETLAAVVTMLFENRAEELSPGTAVEEVPAMWLSTLLRASKLRGVVGGRIFDREGVAKGGWPAQSGARPSPERWE